MHFCLQVTKNPGLNHKDFSSLLKKSRNSPAQSIGSQSAMLLRTKFLLFFHSAILREVGYLPNIHHLMWEESSCYSCGHHVPSQQEGRGRTKELSPSVPLSHFRKENIYISIYILSPQQTSSFISLDSTESKVLS